MGRGETYSEVVEDAEKNGEADPVGDMGGIVAGATSKVYFHTIKLVVGAEMVEIKAGFSWDITANLLGQTGFFDNFTVSFDPTFEPPCFDVERVHRH